MFTFLQMLWWIVAHFLVAFTFPVFVGFMLGQTMGLSLNGTTVPIVISLVVWFPVLGKTVGRYPDGKEKTVLQVIIKVLTGEYGMRP